MLVIGFCFKQITKPLMLRKSLVPQCQMAPLGLRLMSTRLVSSVKYDEDLSARLRNAIEKKSLSTSDKYGILDDYYALSMACIQSLTSLLALMSAYREELDYTALSNLIGIASKVARIVADAAPELIDEIKLFFINLFQNSAERLGWDPKPEESHLDAMLRGELLTALAAFGHDLTIIEANRQYMLLWCWV